MCHIFFLLVRTASFSYGLHSTRTLSLLSFFPRCFLALEVPEVTPQDWLKGTMWDGMPYHITLADPAEKVEVRFFFLFSYRFLGFGFFYRTLPLNYPASTSAQTCGSGARCTCMISEFSACASGWACMLCWQDMLKTAFVFEGGVCHPSSAGSSKSWMSGRGGSGACPCKQPSLHVLFF